MCCLYICIQNAEMSIPKLREVTEGTKTKIYCQRNIYIYVGDASLLRYGPSDWVWLRLEINQYHWSILKKKIVFRTNLKQMFKVRPPTSTHTRQRRIGDWRMCSKMPGYCLNNTCNKIGFRINWRRVNQGLIVAPQEEVSLCELRWSGGPNHWPAPSDPAIVYKWRWGVPSSAKTHLRHTVPRQ